MAIFAGGEIEDIQAATRLIGCVLDGDPEKGIAEDARALGEKAKVVAAGIEEG